MISSGFEECLPRSRSLHRILKNSVNFEFRASVAISFVIGRQVATRATDFVLGQVILQKSGFD